MSNQLHETSNNEPRRRVLVEAVKRALAEKGCSLARVPGRGRSNVWVVKKNGKDVRASIRTTRDRWIAFPPLDGGNKWKTLDTVETVYIGAVDSKDQPHRVEVYEVPANEVRQRFNEAYVARTKAGQQILDNFGMWINLDADKRGVVASVGSGIAAKHHPIAVYDMASLLHGQALRASEKLPSDDAGAVAQYPQTTIAQVLADARQRISQLAGVDPAAVKLDIKIEY